MVSRVTRKDVAKDAGVSTATVSNVMNNKDFVSEELRERVLASVKRLGYKPNLTAKSLKTAISMQIAVITNDITNQFFTEVIVGIEEEAYKYGYTITIINLADRDFNIDIILERQYDGVFVMTDNVSMHDLKNIADRNIATAFFSNISNKDIEDFSEDIIMFCPDEYTGAKNLFQYLIDNGHEKIAFFSSRRLKQGVKSKDMRLRAYVDALEENDIELDESLMDFNTNDIKKIVTAAHKILTSENRPTAIFAGNDYYAMITVSVAKSLGFDVPRDISIVGFDNIPMSSIFSPKITTVDMPKRNMGVLAFKEMMEKMNGKTLKPVVFPTKLIVRESSGKKN